MQDLGSTTKEIIFTNTIKDLVKVYEEISIIKIRRIRESVMNARIFVQDVYPLFVEVKEIYKNTIIKAAGGSAKFRKSEQKTGERYIFSTIDKNGQNLSIIITPNDRLVGDVGEKVFENFFNASIYDDSDILIMGKLGKRLATTKLRNTDYTYFDLPESSESSGLEKIISYIIQYENVEVFYPRLINFLNQKSVNEDLTANVDSVGSQIGMPTITAGRNYIFEPSVDEILNFFEIEIFTSIFKEKIFETELAKLGSRVRAMERASINTNSALKKLHTLKFFLEKSASNKSQLERISGISLWSNSL